MLSEGERNNIVCCATANVQIYTVYIHTHTHGGCHSGFPESLCSPRAIFPSRTRGNNQKKNMRPLCYVRSFWSRSRFSCCCTYIPYNAEKSFCWRLYSRIIDTRAISLYSAAAAAPAILYVLPAHCTARECNARFDIMQCFGIRRFANELARANFTCQQRCVSLMRWPVRCAFSAARIFFIIISLVWSKNEKCRSHLDNKCFLYFIFRAISERV